MITLFLFVACKCAFHFREIGLTCRDGAEEGEWPTCHRDDCDGGEFVVVCSSGDDLDDGGDWYETCAYRENGRPIGCELVYPNGGMGDDDVEAWGADPCEVCADNEEFVSRRCPE